MGLTSAVWKDVLQIITTHPNLIKLETQEECGTSLVDFTQILYAKFYLH